MTTRAIIIFPYGGLRNKVQSGIFWKLFDCCIKITLNPPVIVVSMETKHNGKADNFYKDRHYLHIVFPELNYISSDSGFF